MRTRVPDNPHPVPMPDMDNFSEEEIDDLLIDNFLKKLEVHSHAPRNPHPVPMPSIETDYQSKKVKRRIRRLLK